MHLPELIQDLTLILISACLVIVLFKKLKQPIVLGYILSGFIVSPHVPIFPNILNQKSIHVWAEIGVIFLLFALGLEFSFKKLLRVGAPASVTAITEVFIMTLLGFGIGQLLSWSTMDSIFLGGILAISSTTIIIRAFEETKVKNLGFASIVFGVLIVEDLVAILLLVLLSTLAVSREFEGTQLLLSIGKLGFFLVICFLSGIFLIPPILKKLKNLLCEETILIVSLALCLLMASLATSVGFSPALGAFLMGTILAETSESERIEHLIKPVKDLFAAIFFVSVGMLINPKVLVEFAWPILLITLATVIGKLISTAFGVLLSGQSLRNAIQSGLSLAQIGEFSFIIAALGQTLKVTSDFLYPIAVGVSAITTLLTPYFIRSSNSVYNFIEKIIPIKWQKYFEKYQIQISNISSTHEWITYLKSSIIHILINVIPTIAIFLSIEKFILPILNNYLINFSGLTSLIIALLCSSPFLWSMLFIKNKNLKFLSNNNNLPFIMFEILKFFIAIIILGTLITRFIPIGFTLLIALVSVTIFFVVFNKNIEFIYKWLEKQFVKNLSEKETESKEGSHSLVPWDAHIVKLTISPESPLIGKSLSEIRIREKYSVTIVLIERGQKKIAAPGRDESLYPHDKISIIGTDEQILKFQEEITNTNNKEEKNISQSKYTLQQVIIPLGSTFCDKTILESNFKNETQGLIVGIERRQQRFLNPDSSMKFQENDIVWTVADIEKIQKLKISGKLL
jgi:CPA2 family monovalent cation:H+ antiporter-2